MRAAIYARFSTDKQSDNSIEDQARNCVRYAERAGMNVVLRFEDKAISGASKARAGYQTMLAAAERREFEVLLVDDLSRLSRDDVEMKQVIRRFKFRHIRIIGVSDGYDSSTKGEKIQSTMRGLMNEIYLDDLREKTHRGLYGKAMNGFSAGGRPYGYKRVPIENHSKLDVNGRPEITAVRREVNEDEAKWVRKIFEWFAGGHSPKRIADKLNRLGVPSTRNSTWAANAIYGDVIEGTGLLNNRLYIGEYLWNRSEWKKDPDTGKRKRVKRSRSEWVITPMEELRIVPQPLWDAVQTRQKEIRERSVALRQALSNPKTRSRTGKYLFSGILQCGCCGANYTMYSTSSYACAVNINRGNAACSNKLRISRKVLEDNLLEIIKDELLTDEAVAEFIKETSVVLKEKQNEQKPEYETQKLKLKEAEKRIENIMAAIKAGVVTPTTKVELERAEAEQREALGALQANTGVSEVLTSFLPEAAERYRELMYDLRNNLNMDVSRARLCLRDLLGRIRLLPNATGKFLEAELRHSTAGLMRLALGFNGDNAFKSRLVAGALISSNFKSEDGLKARLVAGVGFEPTTFRL
ncbi:MAG: recombinase family protein [Bdellovibrionales bacterium]